MSDEADPSEQGELSRAAARDVRTVAKGGAVQIAGQITQRSVSFFFTVVAAAVLGRAGYGLYRTVSQILANASQLALAGFNYASMRFITRARARGDPGGVRGAMRVGLVGSAVGSAVVLVAVLAMAGTIAGWFAEGGEDPGEIADLLRLGAAYVPLFALLQVLRYCTQAYKTMVPSVIAGNVVQPAARFVLGVGALMLGFGVAGAVASLTASVAVAAVMAGWYVTRLMTDDEKRAAPSANVGEMIRFALPQGGSSLLGIQTLGLGIILLGLYENDATVGLFGVALSLQGPGTVFLGGIVNIWAPVVSDLHARGQMERLESLYQTINRWIATFSFPVFGALMLEGDVFLELFFPKFSAAQTAVVILAAGNFFYTGTGPTGYVLSMTGRPGVNFINSLAGVALYIGLAVWLVPRHGLVGMAAVDSIVTALVNSARVVEAKILVGVQPFGRAYAKPVIATLGGAAVLLAWRALPGDSLPLQVAGIVLAALVYIGILRALGMDAEERHVWGEIRGRAFKGRR